MSKPQSRHHHTPEEIAQAMVYQNEGKTIKETAKLCGVSVSTVKTWNRNLRTRGKSYLKPKKRPYTRYPVATKISAVKAYLSGEPIEKVAGRFGILNAQSIHSWSRDSRFRGGLTVEEEQRPIRSNLHVERGTPPEKMPPEEELEFLRMENAILKKAIALKTQVSRSKKKSN